MSQTAAHVRLSPAPLVQRLRGDLERLVFSSAAYRTLLLGGAPTALGATPPPMAVTGAGDAARGAAILRGEMIVAGEHLAGEDPFAAPAGEAAQASLHGFRWLADLRAEGSAAAGARARALVARWLARHGAWSPIAWRGDVLGERLAAWLAECPFFAAGGDAEGFRAEFLCSLARQAHHLGYLARLGGAALGPAGDRRLVALVGAVQAALCLPRAEQRLAKASALLLREANRQVLPDGGHYQRSPAVQLALLDALAGVRAALVAAHRRVPAELQVAIDRMIPMLRFFRHGDGGLALFNHSGEGDPGEIDRVLALAEASGKPPSSAPHMGFQRLAAGRALVLVDTGPPPAPGSDRYAHAGTLSFEMSVGAERLIVNCGARRHAKGDWLIAQRATAAHSTLALANANSAELLPSGQLGERARHVICRREEAEGAVLIDASHDGYAPKFGVLHRRRLYLASEGEDLRGEDRLSRVRGGGALPFAVRFHLHPDAQVSLVHDGSAALLRLPSGAGFRFDAAGGRLALEDSIYLGGPGAARRTEQIVIESTLAGDEALVKWSLRRVGAG